MNIGFLDLRGAFSLPDLVQCAPFRVPLSEPAVACSPRGHINTFPRKDGTREGRVRARREGGLEERHWRKRNPWIPDSSSA